MQNAKTKTQNQTELSEQVQKLVLKFHHTNVEHRASNKHARRTCKRSICQPYWMCAYICTWKRRTTLSCTIVQLRKKKNGLQIKHYLLKQKKAYLPTAFPNRATQNTAQHHKRLTWENKQIQSHKFILTWDALTVQNELNDLGFHLSRTTRKIKSRARSNMWRLKSTNASLKLSNWIKWTSVSCGTWLRILNSLTLFQTSPQTGWGMSKVPLTPHIGIHPEKHPSRAHCLRSSSVIKVLVAPSL